MAFWLTIIDKQTLFWSFMNKRLCIRSEYSVLITTDICFSVHMSVSLNFVCGAMLK